MKAVFDNIQTSLLEILDTAKSSIEIAVAWFTNAVLMECLINKLSQGVKVTLILNNDSINNNKLNVRYLETLITKGCKIHWINYPELMHQKFCVIDNVLVANGSYNWTYYAECHNRENVTIIDNASIVKAFHEEFNKMLSIYPHSDEIPSVGDSGYNKREIDQYRHKDYQFSSNYYNDLPEFKIISDWTDSSVTHFRVESRAKFSFVIKWAQDDSEYLIYSSFDDNKHICEYDESKGIGHANIIGKQCFKLFAIPNGHDISCRVSKDEVLVGNCSQSSNALSNAAILLYSSYQIMPKVLVNEHLRFRYNKFCIAVQISIESTVADSFEFSIESMLGIKEWQQSKKNGRAINIKYISIPDGRRYYMVIRTKKSSVIKIKVEYLKEEHFFELKVKNDTITYVGYFCNQSEKYGTKKLFVQQGIIK